MINYKDLQDFDYVFFDIFDTLLFRKVNPEYVKKIWCNHVIKYFDLKINMIDLYQYRSDREIQLSNYNLDKGFDQEFKYCDLICDIFNYFILDKYKIDYDFFLSICIELEVNIEKNVQKLDSDIISLIKKLKENNKKIFCVSDMYLSKDMLKDIFRHHQIEYLFDDIYVSCELLLNKKTGKLYESVMMSLNVSADKCVMIGDNVYSDFEVPSSLGIKSFHLNRNDIYDFYSKYNTDNSSDKIYEKFCHIANSSTDNFEHAIFSLYTFIERLYYNLLKSGKDEVVFLSREGEFLKKLFDIYVSKIYNKKIISKYMIVSRKSTYLPSLKPIEYEDFSFLLEQYSYISVYEFLKSLNFTDQEISEVKKTIIDKPKTYFANEFYLKKEETDKISEIITLDLNDKVPYFKDSVVFRRLLKNKKFIEIYESKRICQNKNFKKYVKQITNNKNISVVDIGWNGSIQDNIQNILGDSYHIDGYYLGLEKRNKLFDTNKKGLVFSNVPVYSRAYKLYNVNRAIYEILLGASHGSANMYVEKNGKIDVELFSMKEESELYNQVISKIQCNMLDSFSMLCDLFANGFYDTYKYDKLFNRVHFDMMFKPNMKQIEFFNNIYHYENFGLFEFTTFNKNNKLSFKSKLKQNVKFLIKHHKYFDDCFWPMLKLYNYDMKFAIFLYRNLKKIQFLKKDII